MSSFDPFSSLPLPIQILFWSALVVTVVQLVLVACLSIRGLIEQRRAAALADDGCVTEADYLWVFLVPALNEEITIGDTLVRLEQVEVTHRRVVVIDDGSTDRTAAILAASDCPDLQVLTRALPRARTGKGDALNDAWSRLARELPTEIRERFGPDRTLVVIVDADGRLDPTFASAVAQQFADPRVGGVQLAVRIYNRRRLLTYLQDVEFRMFGSVYQLGRSAWGTAGMGGNGQINRLSALNDVARRWAAAKGDSVGARSIVDGPLADGPWRDRLTEDQDLGLSLVAAGWRCREEMRCRVDQQGLSSYRRLFRQRVRWCQGNMQSMARAGVFRRAPQLPFTARADGVYWLLQPVVQSIIGASTVTAIILAVFFPELVRPSWGVLICMVLLFLGFGGTAVGSVRAETANDTPHLVRAVLVIVPYALYCWILMPIYPVAWFRLLAGRRTWAKTARESLDQGAGVIEGPPRSPTA